MNSKLVFISWVSSPENISVYSFEMLIALFVLSFITSGYAQACVAGWDYFPKTNKCYGVMISNYSNSIFSFPSDRLRRVMGIERCGLRESRRQNGLHPFG